MPLFRGGGIIVVFGGGGVLFSDIHPLRLLGLVRAQGLKKGKEKPLQGNFENTIFDEYIGR